MKTFYILAAVALIAIKATEYAATAYADAALVAALRLLGA